jgi:hypothetical protein
MRLGDIKAKQAVFQAVDPVYGEPIEDVKITFKPRSDVEAYEKFNEQIRAGALQTPEGIAQGFFGILESGKLGDYEFTAEGLQDLLEDENSAFIGNQIVNFFSDLSNFFTVPPPVVEEEQPAKPRKKKK